MNYFESINGKGAIMTCIQSPKLSDGELLAYLGGDASPQINAHLAECTICRERATTLAAQEKHLLISLYRSHCPSSLALGEYQIGLLGAAEMRAVRFHLQHCPHCNHELQCLTDYLAEVAPTLEIEPSRTFFERSRILVTRLVEEWSTLGALNGLAEGSILATAGLRGEAGEQLVYAAEEVQVLIDVQPDLQHPAQRMLLGLLLGLAAPQTVTAQLWLAEPTTKPGSQPLAMTTVDELGNFILADLLPGTYDLVLSDDTTEVRVEGVVV